MIKWAFKQIADGVFNTEQIYKLARKNGLGVAKAVFWHIIRNAFYCGKIFVPKHKEEEAHFVKGQHEPLISEFLYYQVQDVLDGRKKPLKPKYIAQNNFPKIQFSNLFLHDLRRLANLNI